MIEATGFHTRENVVRNIDPQSSSAPSRTTPHTRRPESGANAVLRKPSALSASPSMNGLLGTMGCSSPANARAPWILG